MKTWRQNPQGYSNADLEEKRQHAIRRMGEQWLLNEKAESRLPRKLSGHTAEQERVADQQKQAPLQPQRHLKRVA